MFTKNQTKIRLLLFIAAAAVLLPGCAGNSGTDDRHGAAPGSESSENLSAVQNGDNAAATQNGGNAFVTQSGQGAGAAQQESPETARPGAADPVQPAPGWQYSWQEITAVFPADWGDRCVIVDNTDGFSIFQKASYEEDSGLGFVCSFLRTTEYLNFGAGETLLAYTEGGQLYYLMRATDFACDAENAEIAGEYARMCSQVDDVMASVQISAGDIHYDAWEYVLPFSNLLPLSREELANLSDNELWVARNEIFARHGRMFSNFYLQRHFDCCTWYQGTVSPEQFDEKVLSRTERDNLQLLIAAEQEYDRRHPYPRQYKLTDTAAVDLSGDGVSNRISYQVIQDGASYQVTPWRCEITIDGTSYDLENAGNLYIHHPLTDAFYITDIVEDDGFLEIAILDDGPSDDPITYFFRYDGALSYIGSVSGFPFSDIAGGIGKNGFNGFGGIVGEDRTDLIETSYPEGYWQYDFTRNQLVYQDIEWHSYPFPSAHTLYEDLPVHSRPDASSGISFIPADTEVYFLATDMKAWILVKGKNGDKGYMQVADGKIVDLDKIAYEVISDLYFFD